MNSMWNDFFDSVEDFIARNYFTSFTFSSIEDEWKRTSEKKNCAS